MAIFNSYVKLPEGRLRSSVKSALKGAYLPVNVHIDVDNPPCADHFLKGFPMGVRKHLCKRLNHELLIIFWVNYNDLTATSLGMMVSKGDYP